jgi:hypothetical protein
MSFEGWLAECHGIVAKKLGSDETAEKMILPATSVYRAKFDRGLTPLEAVEDEFMSWHD